MELCKYRLWFLPPVVLQVRMITLVSQIHLSWGVSWFSISIGTDGFSPHALKFFEISWLVELGDCLRHLLGKSYKKKEKKNSTEEIGQWICGKICAERNTSASFCSWYCLANTVQINWNMYFPLYDWNWNYIVFSLSLLALCILNSMHYFQFSCWSAV